MSSGQCDDQVWSSRPAITTPLANGSLGAQPGKEILVGSSAEELAQHIITLLTEPDKAAQIAQAGFDFTHRVYDWGKSTAIMEDAMVSVGRTTCVHPNDQRH